MFFPIKYPINTDGMRNKFAANVSRVIKPLIKSDTTVTVSMIEK